MADLRASGQALPPAEDVSITFGPSVPWPPAVGADPATGSVTVVLGPPRTAIV